MWENTKKINTKKIFTNFLTFGGSVSIYLNRVCGYALGTVVVTREWVMDIKARIKELMKERELSIYALAVKFDLSQACIANWYSKIKTIVSLKSE